MSIDIQSVKSGVFTALEKGIDGNKKVNGRKRHVVTDTLGLVWGMVISAAHKPDGAMAGQVVEPLLDYLHCMKKILADQAYKNVFWTGWTALLWGWKLSFPHDLLVKKGLFLSNGDGLLNALSAPSTSSKDWIKI